MDATVDSGPPQATVSSVRAKIASGDLAMARTMFEALSRRAGPVTDVLVTEALLWEAEGDLEAALTSVQRAAAAAPGSIHANAQSARLLALLGRWAEAEAAALATLALDDVNIHSLTMLADVYRQGGRTEERLTLLQRLALCSACPEAAAWEAIDELAKAKRWSQIIDILDQRGLELGLRRVSMQHLEALLELGRERDALAILLGYYAKGQLKVGPVIDSLVARGALGLAAAFIHQALSGESGESRARASVVSAARKTCDATSLQDSPFAFSDAVRALEILLPDRESLNRAVARSVIFLIKQARIHLAEGDYSLATDFLIRAGRLPPTDRTTLELLADTALKAGRPDRHLDTLLRIHGAFPDTRGLIAATDAAFFAGRWSLIAELMVEAESPDGRAQADWRGAADELRSRLRRRLDDFLNDEDWEGGLALLTGLRQWMKAAEWPTAAVARLLAGAKRRLRGQRDSNDISDARLASLYLLADPANVDVRRLLARIQVRQRRFEEVLDSLSQVVEVDPHLARDWVDLAMAHHELGDVGQREACTARALVISPAIALPNFLEEFRAGIAG